MKKTALLALAFVGLAACCHGQLTNVTRPAEDQLPDKRATAGDQLPNKQETADYLMGKLMAFSMSDGQNEYKKVTFDNTNNVLAVKYSSGHFIKFLFLNLDANNMRWEASSTSDIQVRYVGNVEVPVAVHWNELRLIVYSRLGTPARIGTDYNQDRMILIFDQDKIDDMPAFKRKLENSVKRLIALCGGKVEAKDPFD